jgi:hypothetical protein
LAAGLGPLAETMCIGQAALRDFVAAEPVSHDIDDFLQAEIRQAGKDLSGGRVTRAGDVLEIAFVLFDTGRSRAFRFARLKLLLDDCSHYRVHLSTKHHVTINFHRPKSTLSVVRNI